jgi:DNA-binding HxlR family transcriptional regulator
MNYRAERCATIAGMALPKDYAGEVCSLARALEVVGERWTLLIVRDAFVGVRRFSDFAAHLDIPRAVLTHRLAALVESDVLAVVPGAHGHDEYVLTTKGLDLWPVVRGLLAWGDDHYSPAGPRRGFRHAPDLRRLRGPGPGGRPRGHPRAGLGAPPGQDGRGLGRPAGAAPPADVRPGLLTSRASVTSPTWARSGCRPSRRRPSWP